MVIAITVDENEFCYVNSFDLLNYNQTQLNKRIRSITFIVHSFDTCILRNAFIIRKGTKVKNITRTNIFNCLPSL